VLKVCRTPGPTACLKMLNKVCLKSWRKEKKFHDWTRAALNLQPFDLRSNTYRSLPGGQVFSPCYFHVSCTPRKNFFGKAISSYDGLWTSPPSLNVTVNVLNKILISKTSILC